MCSSVVERCPDKTEVEGPIPSTRTAGEFWRKPKREGVGNLEYIARSESEYDTKGVLNL